MEIIFGGLFEIEVNYCDFYVVELIEDDGWMLWLLICYSYDIINYEFMVLVLVLFLVENWLGIDD